MTEVFMALDAPIPAGAGEKREPRVLMRAPVLRTILVSRSELIAHWETNHCLKVSDQDRRLIEEEIPLVTWLVEVSLSEIYTVNKAKIADIAINAMRKFGDGVNAWRTCCVIRTPDHFILPQKNDKVIDSGADKRYFPIFRSAKTPSTQER
jgi:hypothetical protein